MIGKNHVEAMKYAYSKVTIYAIMNLSLSTQKKNKPKQLARYALLEKLIKHNHFVERMIN